MTDLDDPPRWSEPGGGGPDSVRRVLDECRGDVGTDAEVAALDARLAPLLWTPTGGGPSGSGSGGSAGGSAAAGKAALVKLGVIATATAGALGVWIATSRAPAPRPRPARAPEIAASASLVPVQRKSVEPEVAPNIDPEANAGPSGAPLATSPRTASPPHAPAARTAAAPSEADLLGRAQTALTANPAQALALTAEHQKKFPQGILVQEREVIAIEALRRLGRTSEASARAARFVTRYPRSAHRSKISEFVRPR